MYCVSSQPTLYKDIDKYVLDAAAERGTRIHEACEAYDLYGELPDYEEDYDITNYVVACTANYTRTISRCG